MKIFLKYILKSMIEKKGRFLLLIIAISLSTALLIASRGMVDIILDSLVTPQLEAYENKDIIINTTDESASFFTDEGLDTSGLDKDSILKEIYIEGMMADKVDTKDETMLYITVRGRALQDINKELITQGDLNSFVNNSCIVSERIAKERDLEIGDSLAVVIGGITKDLTIVAISGNAGVFYNDTDSAFAVLVPYEYLSTDFGQEGKYNFITANSSESSVQEGVDKFNENNSSFSAEKLFDEQATKKQLSSFTYILYVMLVVVVLMSAIIIYSSFKLIITERLKTIGTFLSQGATTGKVKFILYLESVVYGIGGALFGNILGIIALHVINRLISPLKDYGIYSTITIKPDYIIVGVVFAVFVSLLSAFLPIFRISKLQVKDIILNDVRITNAIGWKKFIIGLVLLGGSIVATIGWGDKLGAFSALLILTSLSGVIFAFPKLIELLSRFLYRILKGKSKNVIYAINNLRTSKILLGNITLIIISLVSIITITSLGTSMINVVTQAYTQLEFDIEISNISTVRENSEESRADYLVRRLKELGVKEDDINCNTYQYGEIKNTQKDIVSISVMGINTDTYLEYNQYLKLYKSEYSQYIKDFEKDDEGVIITNALSKISDKQVGDSIEITCNGLTQTLTISGVIDGKLYNNGYFVLVKNKTMNSLFGIASANSITFNTNDTQKLVEELKPILREIGAVAITRDKMCEENLEQNKMIVNALSIFSYMAIIIASLGIMNNVSISFLQRKNEFAVMASVGMENSGRTKILFVESIACVTWAMAITSLYSIFALKLVTILVKTIGFDMPITLDLKSLPFIYAISLVIVLLASIPVYFKSKKLSIIAELKYE